MNNTKIRLIRADAVNNDFIELVVELDSILRKIDGVEHLFFAQFNRSDHLDKVVVVYYGKIPAACGALKKYSENTAEIKRMYVRPEYRGKGFAKNILHELEKWASELNYTECILETGRDLKAAVGLYQSSGYEVISNYGQYAGVVRSICFRKILIVV
jgi:GNAT superfamily N-acetyltransferase